MVTSLKRVGCVSGRTSEIRAAETCDHSEIYADTLSVSVKQRPARTTGCGRGIVHDLVLKHVADVSLRRGWPDEPLRCNLRHDIADVLTSACNFLRDVRTRPCQNAFHPGRIPDQDYRPSGHASFTSIIKFQQLRAIWRRSLQF